MKDPYDMTDTEFKAALAKLTTPGEIFRNARNIYDFLTNLFKSDCNDSLMREWAFQWYAHHMVQVTGNSFAEQYDVIYEEWLMK